jgi:hypothetical protein
MSSFSRPNDRKRNRDHIPTMHSEQLARPQSTANIDIAGPRNPDLMARRQQERKPSDGATFLKAFGKDKPKFPIQNPFHAASHKFEQQDRLAHMQLRDVLRPCVPQDIPRPQSKVSQSISDKFLTPQASNSNGLLATKKVNVTQLANDANSLNGGSPWLNEVRNATPHKRSFSEAKLFTDVCTPSAVAATKPKISTSTRGVMLMGDPDLHPASHHVQHAVFNAVTHALQHPPAIPSETFYSTGTSQHRAVSSGPRNHVISPLPVCFTSDKDAFTPESSYPARTTRSQAKRPTTSSSAPSDQSVVIIDSDDEGINLQSPKYTSPKTNSERKSVLERMIPLNIVQSFRSFCHEAWVFAYPVKDCRGILHDELSSDPEAGDYASILPYNKGAVIAFLFFTRNGDVVLVPEDGHRDFSLPARSPEKFCLADCASVITTLNTEEKTDSKNEFVLFFAFKPSARFTPHFDSSSKSAPDEQPLEDDDGVVLVDDVASAGHAGSTPFAPVFSSSLGDTLPLDDTQNSIISVDDAKSFSSVGFKVQNPVFVDNCASLRETDFTLNVKRFNDFICSIIQSPGSSRVGRVLNATSAFTHVTIGIPRGKPSQIVEDPTELLDYKIPEPEKSFCATNDSTSTSSLRSKKTTFVHRVISVGDFARLDKGECLSDATIDFYSSWLRETHPDKCRGVYFASSFFFKKLWSQQRDSKESTDFSYMHKWNSIDIFTFDRVMFPVNLNYHWSLIVLENPCALLQPKGAGRCRLLYMDSLKTWDQQISQLFSCWITWMHMRQTERGELTPLVNFATIMLEGKKQVLFSLHFMARSCGY